MALPTHLEGTKDPDVRPTGPKAHENVIVTRILSLETLDFGRPARRRRVRRAGLFRPIAIGNLRLRPSREAVGIDTMDISNHW